MVFWFVRVDDEGYPEIARCTEWVFATNSCRYQRRRYVLSGVRHGSLAGRSPPLLMLPLFADIFQQGNRFVRGEVAVVTRLSTLVSTSGI